KNANNKRKFENQPKDNRVPQQPPFKKPDVARAYTIGANEKKAYARNLPYCNKCKLHHVGPCTVKCSKYKRVGHMTRDCKASVAAMNQRAHVVNLKATITCYECGRLGHFRNECQKLRNQNQEEHSLGDLNEPTSYKAAMLDSESNKWIDAMNAEIQSMMDNMVWVLVDLPPGYKTVGSK
ncbi:reverse transcriptase domain-containing protein, partial [Tanacetum coccineum]